MVDSVVTKQELIDAQKDAQSLEDVINGPADTRVKPRIGPEMWTLATINSLVQQGQIKISDLSEAIQIALAAGAGTTAPSGYPPTGISYFLPPNRFISFWV